MSDGTVTNQKVALFNTTGGAGTGAGGTFISNLADQFEDAKIKGGADGKTDVTLIANLNDKIAALAKDSSDPAALAQYQKAIMVYTVHQNSQSSLIKSIADLDKGIIHNFS